MDIKRVADLLIVAGYVASVEHVTLEVVDYGDEFFDMHFTKGGNLFGDSALCACEVH